MKKRVLLVFGTRPEAIKMAPVYFSLKKSEDYIPIVCVTAQHREMLDQVLAIFNIIPEYDLDLMTKGQTLAELTSRLFLEFPKILNQLKPDMVLVHGDTSTTMVAAVSCFYSNIPVGHVEAGLRTNNIYSPFPEEFNRQIVSKISTLHFAPTQLSAENLIAENINNEKIFITGNTVIDALFKVKSDLNSSPQELSRKIVDLNKTTGFDIDKEKYILITGHRRENFGEGIKNICLAFQTLSQKFQDIHFVYPVHLNPNIKGPVHELLKNQSNFHLIDPLGYEEFLLLMDKSYFVVTDSGGIQEEAPSLGKPVILMRDNTERQEAVEAGTVLLSGTNHDSIVSSVSRLLEEENFYSFMSQANNPFGDGTSSEKILEALNSFFEAKI